MFSATDYVRLYDIVFNSDYPGYKPDVIESPNRDGKKDHLKRYAHVAEKYLALCDRGPSKQYLNGCLDKAHTISMEVALAIGVPRQYWPVKEYGALRVLEYGPEAITNEHTDFDLFTLMLYRNLPQYFRYTTLDYKGGNFLVTNEGTTELMKHQTNQRLLKRAQQVNNQVHFGEILEEIAPDTYKASGHEVVSSGGPHQYSIVYFAIPDHSAVLPNGVGVGKWLNERKSRSRYDKNG